jgi:hypothetical protein
MDKEKLKKIAKKSLAKSLEKRKKQKPGKIFNFNGLVSKLHQLIEKFPDTGTGKNINKSIKEKYKIIRNRLPTRKTFFENIRALTCYIWFDNWNHLMIFMRCGLWIGSKNTNRAR